MNQARRQQLMDQARRLRGLDRILLVGCSGAGKSTFAARMGPALGLPVVHLDREYWLPGWTEPDKDAWQARIGELVESERWLMDGNYSATFEARVARAQAVIFFDFPRWLCLSRIARRVATFFGRSRPDMGEGCPEQVDFVFLKWVWDYNKRSRPKILDYIEHYAAGREMLVLAGPEEVEVVTSILSAADAAAVQAQD